ncbi:MULTISPECIES: hypothetical protein [Rhizobium]|nr:MULTISPECIES: hypothetical protein [Rhizobium]MBB4295041.1 hypothetical protein [Rhizobium leguminosarum]MBB4417985.1 hypothetical protein [Rhizobium leguminosarum]MBB4432830.1 hypothetical protein [Rhizobium esperanzae]MBB4542333.1 hypothetical protein [Rhizobium leguminosarum]MBB5650087.1 hypothetical protein [Rhizobium leguminosarum]
MDMEDLNEAGNGSEDFGASDGAPVSIRDSLKAAIDTVEGNGPGELTGQPRDGDNGRFLAKGQEQAAAARAGQAPAANAALAAQQQTPQAQSRAQSGDQPASIGSRVPPGWSAEAKAQFASLPGEVQAAITKREQEVDNGFRVLQDYKGLEEFTPLIRQAGMTHADVMRRAIDWEKALIHDPVNTVVHVARMAGVNLHALVNGQTGEILQRNPQQAGLQQGGPQPRSINVEATVEHVLRKRDTETQVDAFLSDPVNAHAEDVLDDMVALINAGRATSLQDAYDAACWMRPDIRRQLISQTAPAPVHPQQAQRAAAADQARRASRSISGSSAPGPTRDAARGQPTSIRDSLRDAMRFSRGQV